MPPSASVVLCRYLYDPLDRLAGSVPMAQAQVRRFYRQKRLATEVQGAVQHTIFHSHEQPLAEQRHLESSITTTLLATDRQRSVVQRVDPASSEPLVYDTYGYQVPQSGLGSLLGFNGERRDPLTGHYLLGNGYRAFNPVLMRFNSPDSLSPFGAGGLNAYAYCQGDPVNFQDVTGAIRTAPKPIATSSGKPLSRGKRPSLAQVARKIIDAKKLDTALEQFLDNEQALLNKFAPAPSSPRAGSSSSTPAQSSGQVVGAAVQSNELETAVLNRYTTKMRHFEHTLKVGPDGGEFAPLVGKSANSRGRLQGFYVASEDALKVAEHYRYTGNKRLQIKYLVYFLRTAAVASDYAVRHQQAYGEYYPRRLPQ